MSKIEWTEATWNPLTGCTKVSAGCKNCYAERLAKRLKAMGQPQYQDVLTDSGRWNGEISFVETVLLQPLQRKKPTMYFVNSMSDVFHEAVRTEWIDQIFAVMALCPQHTFQILTKRPERMAAYLTERGSAASPKDAGAAAERLGAIFADIAFMHGKVGAKAMKRAIAWLERNNQVSHLGWMPVWPLLNVWLGTSVENQAAADERIPHLLQTPAAVRFLSCEPLLGPVDIGMQSATCDCCSRHPGRWIRTNKLVTSDLPGLIRPFKSALPGVYRAHSNQHGALSVETSSGRLGVYPSEFEYLPRLDWVICGGESGPGARPMHPDWARGLRDQCQAAGVPYFFKQWGEFYPCEAVPSSAWGEGRSFAFEDGQQLVRLGKKVAGRELDGRTWDEMPTPAQVAA